MKCERCRTPEYEQSSRASDLALPSTPSAWVIAAVSLLLLATFAAYAAALHFGFVYDDFTIIVFNERVHSSRFIAQYFTQQVWGSNASPVPNLYRPLFLTWLLFNYEMFGLSPAGWHLTSILLHLLATWLVFRLSAKLLGKHNSYAALISAALFGLHPIHVEAVAWVSGVTELLSTCLFLGSVLCFIEARSDRRPVWFSMSLLLFAGALISKETAIVLPMVVLCYLLVFPENNSRTSHSRSLISNCAPLLPYVLIAAGYLGVRYAVLHGIAHSVSDRPVWSSVLLVPWALKFYIGRWLLPVGLGPFYDIDRSRALSAPALIVAFALIPGLMACIFLWTRKTRSNLPLFLCAWFVLTLGPALGILLLMTRYEGVHDRYLYLPSVALAIIGGSLWSLFFPAGARLKGIQQVVCATVLVAVLGFATRQQAQYWQNDLALFTRACAVAPQNAMARLNLAAELLRRGRFEQSLYESERVITQDSQLAIAYNLAAEASFQLGKYAKAETDYLKSLRLSPPNPKELCYLGMAQVKLRKYSEGVAVLERALALWPDAPMLHYAMGMAFAEMGNWPGAREQYQLELQLHPKTPGVKATLLEAEQHFTSQNQPAPSESIASRGIRQ